jgi:hypothetical protein
MSRLVWGEDRSFEQGVSRGVFYPDSEEGVALNGLISVAESSVGGESTSHFLDGVKMLEFFTGRDFQAVVTALSIPKEFQTFLGNKMYVRGFWLGNQIKPRFDFTYRTEIDDGYKVHLVYNALALIENRSFRTLGGVVVPSPISWRVHAIPVVVPNFRPTAHFVVDSTQASEARMTSLENILYGTTSTASRFPSIVELLSIFSGGA